MGKCSNKAEKVRKGERARKKLRKNRKGRVQEEINKKQTKKKGTNS